MAAWPYHALMIFTPGSTAPSGASLNVNKPTTTTTPSTAPSGAPNKVTITKEFDFAGEVVKVTKDIDVSSKEGQKELKRLEKSEEKSSGAKKPVGGLGSVLNKINRKEKMSTLDKSKLDWETFKTKEGISEELQIHNRGKQGYIERMQFLNRTDQRQFEIERDLRLGTSSSKR
ncbi:hypothetical protein FSP39_016502 [Pinctada imbricata]|uniref:Craniofacial development protein 1 n=1 Tax=Pinctada imbricata TaxID=66713 RepID=A0AA88XZI0_PINIB|nr:hypothetical protein FSP39_016502 [Pinctada imbricata]